ncbi:MAG: hypothetical protein KJ737_10890 [Proteobacteria bacterium]|nr:hypothetical protein [Pseudomonadota bacterium]
MPNKHTFQICNKRFLWIEQCLSIFFPLAIVFVLLSLYLSSAHAFPLEKDAGNGVSKVPAAAEIYTENDISVRIKALETRIEQVQHSINDNTFVPINMTVDELKEYQNRLITTLNTFQRIENALKKRRVLEEDETLLRKKKR